MNKRFIITIANEYLDTEKDEWLSIEEVFDLLNNFNNENQQLKKENETLSSELSIYKQEINGIRELAEKTLKMVGGH